MPREKRSAAELNEYRNAEKRRQSEKWECHCEKPGCPGGLVSQSTWRTHRAWTEARAQEKKNREGVEDLFAGYPPFHELEPGVDMAVDDVSEPDHERKEPPLIDSDDDIFGDQWPPAPDLADDDLDPPDPNAPVYGPHPQPRHTHTPPNTTCTQATKQKKKLHRATHTHTHAHNTQRSHHVKCRSTLTHTWCTRQRATSYLKLRAYSHGMQVSRAANGAS
jgi:hypothetical protein